MRPERYSNICKMAGIRGIEPRSLDRQSSVLTDKRYAQIFIIDFLLHIYYIIFFIKNQLCIFERFKIRAMQASVD